MEKRKWYNKDMETSLLGFGVMRVKMENGKICEKEALEIFDYAYKNGVNYFDTAMPYSDGQNESITGLALSRYPRDSFYLATKLSLWMFKSKEEIYPVIDEQLKRLRTTYIDNYLLHSLNKEKLQKIKEWGVLDIVKQWKEEGKIRNIGFSFHDDYDTFKEILNLYDWDFCQIQLNYLDTDIQQGIKGYFDLENKNIPVVVMEPIKGGRLANFNEKASHLFTDYSSDSLSKWALRWVGSLPGVKVVLSGMNEMKQIEENVETFNNFQVLNNEEQQLILKVKEELKKAIAVGCTNCKYCMPCPAGVNIPKNFALYNELEMYQAPNYYGYRELLDNKADPSVCVKCGKCMKECPQHLNIPFELEKFKDAMDKLNPSK